MASIIPATLEECVVVYNPRETDSDKIATKLSATATELTAVGGSTGAKITKVSCMSTADEKQQAKTTCSSYRNVATLFVITEDMVGEEDAKAFLNMMVNAVSEVENAKVLTVLCKVHLERIPAELQVQPYLYYEAPDFKTQLENTIRELLLKPAAVPDPKIFRVSCYLMVEVHPIKGKAKQGGGAKGEVKEIQEAVNMILNDPNRPLAQTLLADYMIIVRDVSLNPFKVICKVKDETWWGRVVAACEDRTLGALFMSHVTALLNKSLTHELRVMPHKEASVASGGGPVDSIVANTIINVIKDRKFTTYDFYQKLLNFKDKADLRSIRSDEGYNPLHAIIVYNRLPLMLPLVQLQLFSAYVHETVTGTGGTSFRGHTPRQIADAKKARRFREALEENERLVHSMGKFLKACHDGDSALVRRMLHGQPQLLQEKDSQRNNCLNWAIVSNNLDLFQMLVKEKADVSNVNNSKETLLHTACMLGHSKFIGALMEAPCSQDVTLVCSNKRTPLECVAENGDVESLKELLKYNVKLTACVLPYAATNGRINFLKYVVEESKQHMHVDTRDNTGRSALMKACESGHTDIVEYLIARGATVSVQDQRNRTPLHVAAENGHVKVVELLLKHNAEINVHDKYTGAELCFLIRGKDKGRKAWHYVEVRRNLVHIFLQKTRAGQVDVTVYGTVVKSGWGEDPEKSIVEWVERMFMDRCKSSAPDVAEDITPLHMAIYKEQPAIARLLVNHGADVNARDRFGLTPFMMCALRNDKDTAVLLEERGARLEDKDKEGHTALEIAELNDQRDMVNYIMGKSYFRKAQEYLDTAVAGMKEALKKENLQSPIMASSGTSEVAGAGTDFSRAYDSGMGSVTVPMDASSVPLSRPLVRASEPSANVNSVDQQGSSNARLLVNQNDKDTAVLLEERGARLEDKDKEGHTALEIPELNDQRDMVSYIMGRSASNGASEGAAATADVSPGDDTGSGPGDASPVNGADGGDVRECIQNNSSQRNLGSGPIVSASSGTSEGAGVGTDFSRAYDSGMGSVTVPMDASSVPLSTPVRASEPSANLNSVDQQLLRKMMCVIEVRLPSTNIDVDSYIQLGLPMDTDS